MRGKTAREEMSVSRPDVSVFSPALAKERPAGGVSRLRIRELRNWEGLPELENAWNELLARSATGIGSLAWEWIRSCWEAQGPGHELKLLFCTNTGGELAAILPLMRSRERFLPGISAWVLRLIGDGFAGSEHFNWILGQGSERAVVCEVLDWLDQNALEWDILALNTVPASCSVACELRDQMAARAWRVIETETSGCILPLPGIRMACARPFSKGATALVMAQTAKKGKDWLRARNFGDLWSRLRQSYRRFWRAKP